MSYQRVPFKSGQWWEVQIRGADPASKGQKSNTWHLGFLNSPRRAAVLAWCHARPDVPSYYLTRLAIARRMAAFTKGATDRDCQYFGNLFYREMARATGTPLLSVDERRERSRALGYPVR